MLKYAITVALCGFTLSCATVDITKTGAGYFDPVDPSRVEILKTRPDKPYVELGTLDIAGFKPRDTAKMHNAIRTKAAPLGANAVIITDENILRDPYAGAVKYASAVAIRYK